MITTRRLITGNTADLLEGHYIDGPQKDKWWYIAWDDIEVRKTIDNEYMLTMIIGGVVTPIVKISLITQTVEGKNS